MNKTIIDRETIRERLEASYDTLDIPAEVERHIGIGLRQLDSRHQFDGACPYPNCTADGYGFVVWSQLTPRGNHYHCRQCKRAGDIIKLIQDIKGIGFSDACDELGIPNPYQEDYHNHTRPRPKKQRTSEVAKWLLNELQELTIFYPRTKQALQCERARAYLAERAIPFEVAERLGLGYIPAREGFQHRWSDRIIFPVETLDGEIGYCGRALFLWQPGMNEDEHKAKLIAYNQEMREKHSDMASRYQVPRYLYTYKEAYFNLSAIKRFDNLTFVEGPFDVLACLASGVSNAVAMGTTGIDARVLPKRVCSVTMGLDADMLGSALAMRLVKSLKRNGIDVAVCAPPDGAKDWSAAYRLYGVQGLASLIKTVEDVPDEYPPAPVETPIADETSSQQEDCSQPRGYKPVSLLPLPRTACPIREIAWDGKGRQVRHCCKYRPAENGFCAEHQLAYEFLQIGARLDYPEVKIPFTSRIGGQIQMLHRIIHEGVAHWEDQACVSPRLQESINHLKREG